LQLAVKFINMPKKNIEETKATASDKAKDSKKGDKKDGAKKGGAKGKKGQES
jgi:hypothetical protein